ncbi:MAG: DUF1016 N-terminal domain-containing protein [Candidatus Desulfacyla sp.]
MDANGLSRVMPEGIDLFDRVVSILEQARANVVRFVNNNMVIAYWLIGREIVQEIQGGGDRAEYGKQVIEQLSAKLTGKYGRGFSTTNLRYIRTFYLVYSDRVPEIRHIGCGEFKSSGKRHNQSGVLDDMTLAVEQADAAMGFSHNLGWSHYRTLMNVENKKIKMSAFFMKSKPSMKDGMLTISSARCILSYLRGF